MEDKSDEPKSTNQTQEFNQRFLEDLHKLLEDYFNYFQGSPEIISDIFYITAVVTMSLGATQAEIVGSMQNAIFDFQIDHRPKEIYLINEDENEEFGEENG